MTGAPGLASVLASRLRALWGAEAEVTDVRPLPGGASRESWDVRVRTAGGAERRLVLLRDVGGRSRYPDKNVAAEAAAMIAARMAGVPVAEWIADLAAGRRHFAFGITEPGHGSDATFMETRATRVKGDGPGGTGGASPPCTGKAGGGDWVITGEKTWNTGIHTASHDLVFARTSGTPGSGAGITGFLVPVGTPGFKVEEYLWTFNMPTDHGRVSLHDVRVPDSAILGREGRGLEVVQHFFNENRIRQAASSLGASRQARMGDTCRGS